MPTKQRNSIPASEDPEVQQLKREWKVLDRYVKGDRLAILNRSYSQRQLASALGCTPKRLRDYLLFAKFCPSDLRASRRMGTKRLLSELRRRRQTKREWMEQTKGESGRSLRNRLATTLRNWLIENLHPQFWDAFFAEVFNEGCRATVLRDFAPTWDQLAFNSDWQQVIEQTRPPGDPKVYGAYSSLLGFHLRWFSTWIQRCMPFPKIAESVCRRVRKELNEKIRREFGPAFAENWKSPT